MQNKLVIAALLGAVSAKDFTSLKHAIVKSINQDFSKQLHDVEKAIDQGLDNAQDIVSDAEDIVSDAGDFLADFQEDIQE